MSDQPRALGDLAPFPLSIKPMLATLVDKPFSSAKWLFEHGYGKAPPAIDGGQDDESPVFTIDLVGDLKMDGDP